MKRSVNELSGLVLKAVRGAGLHLGTAEDLAMAAPHLDDAGLETLSVALGDHGRHEDLRRLCFVMDARVCGQTAEPPASVSSLAAALAAARSGTGMSTGPRDIPDDLWAVLEYMAQATYVPASKASRATGAGAGLDDND